MFDSLAKAGKYLGQAAKLMIGMPDCDGFMSNAMGLIIPIKRR